jgi:cutinase
VRQTAAVVAMLAALSACSSGPTAPSPTPGQARLVADRCADLIVLGVRGQAQSARASAGVGAEVHHSTRALVGQLDGGERVRLEAIRYPASAASSMAVFDRDVEAGRVELLARHAELGSACPRSRFVIIGYSEGADVVHRAVATMSTKQASDIAVVAVLGDPLRIPTDEVATETYGSGRLHGRGSLAGGPPWGKDVRDRVITFCHADDNVCNVPAAGRQGGISAVHRSFYEKTSSARVTAERMARVIGAS